MRLLLCSALLIALAGCGDKPAASPEATSAPAVNAPKAPGQGLDVPLKAGMVYDTARAALEQAGWQRKERFAYVGSSGAGESDPCKLDGLERAGPALCARYDEMQVCNEDECEMHFKDATGQELIISTTAVTPAAPSPTIKRWSLPKPTPVEQGNLGEADYAPPLEPAPSSTPEAAASGDTSLTREQWVDTCGRTLNEGLKSSGASQAANVEALVFARCECLSRNADPDDLAEMAWFWDAQAGIKSGEYPMPTDPKEAGIVLARFQEAQAAAKRAGAACD